MGSPRNRCSTRSLASPCSARPASKLSIDFIRRGNFATAALVAFLLTTHSWADAQQLTLAGVISDSTQFTTFCRSCRHPFEFSEYLLSG
jgi:hypothetical protein